MRIENLEVGRVAVLVLDYDPEREKDPSNAVKSVYLFLNDKLRRKYPVPSPDAVDVTVLANEELVALHQNDFEQVGVRFIPNWRESPVYRELLKEGLRQGTDIYVMDDVDHITGLKPPKPRPEYVLMPGEEVELEIADPEGLIDIRPREPQYRSHP